MNEDYFNERVRYLNNWISRLETNHKGNSKLIEELKKNNNLILDEIIQIKDDLNDTMEKFDKFGLTEKLEFP